MEKIRRITFGIMLAAVVCVAAACGRNDTNGSAAGQSSGREESSTAPGSRATEEVPGTSATGVDLPLRRKRDRRRERRRHPRYGG